MMMMMMMVMKVDIMFVDYVNCFVRWHKFVAWYELCIIMSNDITIMIGIMYELVHVLLCMQWVKFQAVRCHNTHLVRLARHDDEG